MKRAARLLTLTAAASVAAVLAGCAALAIEDRDVGLRTAGVFETTKPVAFGFDKAAAPIAPLPGSGMPPMIGHGVDEYLPLTLKSNQCLDCHDKPQNIGRPVAAGKPRPVPTGHYRGVAQPGALDGRYHNCLACHAPQADVAPLVRNPAT